MIKVRRFKRLLEADEVVNNQANTTAQPSVNALPAAPAAPVANGQQQTLNPAPANPAPAAPLDLNVLLNQLQQQPTTLNLDLNQNLQNQVQLPLQQPNPKAAELIKNMQNSYWIVANNIPEEILKAFPDFKNGNQQAEPAIKAWETFKLSLTKESYDAFINAFQQYCNDGTLQQPVNNNQPQALTTQLPLAVNAGLLQAYSFKLKLMENLEHATKKDYYNRVINNYFENDKY